MLRHKIWARRLQNLQELLLKSFKLEGLLLLPPTAEPMGFDTSEFDVNDLVTFLTSLDSSRRKLLREISTLRKPLLFMPPTNAVGERSFSALKRVKTYLRSTMGDSRLNHLMHDVACSQGQNRCSHPCRRSLWLRWGERKPKAIVWQIFRERYSKQFLYFVKVNANGKVNTTVVIWHVSRSKL